MNNKEIKRSLQKYKVPKYDSSALEKTIKTIHELTLSNTYKRMNNKDFFISQIGFIRKRTWIMQFIILCTICIFLFSTSVDSNSFYNSLSLISIASPLFVLTNIEELTKVYNLSLIHI